MPPGPLMACLHSGVTLEEVRRLTGFEFRTPPQPPETPALIAEERGLLNGP